METYTNDNIYTYSVNKTTHERRPSAGYQTANHTQIHVEMSIVWKVLFCYYYFFPNKQTNKR